MLTLKQIYENKEAIIAGLEKKHFAGATDAIEEVLRLDGVYYKTADGELAHDISLREAVPLVEVDIDGARTNYYSLAEAIAVASR